MQKIFERVLYQETLTFIIILFFMALLGGLWYGLDVQLKHMEKVTATVEESQEEYKELRKIEEEFELANNKVRLAEAILDIHVQWTRSFQDFENVLPQGVYINNLSFGADRIGVIEGAAVTREALKELNKNLEESICFGEINVPTAAFAQKENANFQIDFIINEECL